MLKACLRSLSEQEIPDHVQLTIVVVETTPRAVARRLSGRRYGTARRLSWFMATSLRSAFPAPNWSIDLALEHGPDWVGFIDDDEVAAPDWIASFATATATVDADVLQGPVEVKYPPECSRLIQKEAKRKPTGTRLGSAYTNNALMRASIVSRKGLALRFDETMRFTGGSDAEFFSRAAARGAVIRWVDEAVVTESVPMERLTLRWQLERARRTGANRVSSASAMTASRARSHGASLTASPRG